MKKLFLILIVAGLSFPVIGQSGSAKFYKSLSTQRGVHPTVKKASASLSRNFTIRDSLLYFTRSFEKAVLSGKSAGLIKPELVKTAQKKYPGNNYRAASNRLKLYATEGKSPTKRRYRN